MSGKTIQLKQRKEVLEGIATAIEMQLLVAPKTDIEKMFFASLDEIKTKALTKLLELKKQYKVTLTAPQALALKILIEHRITNAPLHFAVKIKQIATLIDQHYQ